MLLKASHRRRLEPLSIAVTIAVLVVVLLYIYLELKRPVDLLWPSGEWVVNVEDPRCDRPTEDALAPSAETPSISRIRSPMRKQFLASAADGAKAS
ncbi:MAG: hypothetical protein AAFY88_23560, partial [Acidobacteriota bacterium]